MNDRCDGWVDEERENERYLMDGQMYEERDQAVGWDRWMNEERENE